MTRGFVPACFACQPCLEAPIFPFPISSTFFSCFPAVFSFPLLYLPEQIYVTPLQNPLLGKLHKTYYIIVPMDFFLLPVQLLLTEMKYRAEDGSIMFFPNVCLYV
jgi:hypothetical protein